MIRHALDLLRSMRTRRPAVVVILAIVALAAAPVTLAAGIDPGTLNPAPPDFYSCRATGDGTICRAHTIEPYDLEPTGIFCGSGAGTVEILDSAIRDVDATRWYDREGNLTRRQRTFLFRNAVLTNPANGQTLPYSQHNTDNEVLGVPGDLDSVTLTSHGHLSIAAPGFGVVIIEAGQIVVEPDGNVEFQAGPFQMDRYYGGELELVDDLCAALGTPNS